MYRYLVALVLLLGSCSAPAPKAEEPLKSPDPTPERPTLVHGTVTLKGQAPKPKLITPEVLADVFMKAPQGLRTERVVVDQDNHVQWALVYVKKGLEDKVLPKPPRPETLEMNGFRFSPHVLGIGLGQPLVLRNSDPALHSFHCEGNLNPQVLTLPQGAPNQQALFGNSEVAAHIRCDVHPWEHAWVGILPHSYFAVTGADGSYEIQGLPPGTYRLEVWHEFYKPVTLELVVTGGQTFVANFVLEERKDQ